MSFRDFAQRLFQDWPNAWAYGSATLLFDRRLVEECPPDYRATSVSRVTFLAPHKPEVVILLLGLQIDPKDQAENRRRSAVGLLLRRRLSHSSPVIPTSVETWERVGLLILSVTSERLEEEAIQNNEPYRLLAKSLENSNTIFKDLPYLKGGGPHWKCTSGVFG